MPDSAALLRAAAAILAVALNLPAQTYAPGPQVLTYHSDQDDSEQPYGLYLPRGFDPARKYPLVVSLHGAYSNHRLNLRRVFGRGNRPGETDVEATRYFPPLPDVDFIVASPFARGTLGYRGLAENEVYQVLADVKKRFPIDEDRVYLTGLSMGGGGALWLGLTRPDLWAALAAVCPAPPPGAEEFAPNALNLPVHLFHGELDPLVPATDVRQWQKRLLNLDTRVEYIEYPGVKHNAWDYAYKDAAVFDWFSGHRRAAFPERVRFTTRFYKYGSAYWVRLDALTPGSPAAIDARFESRNRIAVRASGLDGFTLSLAGHPLFAAALPLAVIVDGAAFKLKPQRTVSFSKTGGQWRPQRYQPAPGEKRAGLEGPAAEAVATRHTYVYGTGGAAGEEELQQRRQQAACAGDWSRPPGRVLLTPRVVPDIGVSEADLRASNLVLFGSKETNAWIARLAPRLPLELNAGAADYGLVFVAPIDGRYVLVNSGLPWWTGGEAARRAPLNFIAPVLQVLQSFPDFVLFKGSLDNVVAEGYFDRNWKAPPAEAARLRATGAVFVR